MTRLSIKVEFAGLDFNSARLEKRFVRAIGTTLIRKSTGADLDLDKAYDEYLTERYLGRQ